MQAGFKTVLNILNILILVSLALQSQWFQTPERVCDLPKVTDRKARRSVFTISP